MTALSSIAVAIGAAPVTDGPDAHVDIVDVSHDSRAVGPGWLFCCVPGANVDGHDFAPGAVAAGASALLVERRLDLDVAQLVVDDARAAMGFAAAEVYGHPSDQLTVLGVTGTNGKSSIVQLLADIWQRTGATTEIFGTLTGARTTPEAPDLQRRLQAALARGVSGVAIEVSSHALSLHRVNGTRFAAAIFTNLGRDHLDFHGDLDSYFEAKALLFDPNFTALAVVNLDDPRGVMLAERIAASDAVTLVGYRLADAVDLTFDGTVSRFSWLGHEIILRLAGHHNVSNALAAAATARALGLDERVIADALCATEPVRGRFEIVEGGQPFTVAIDYAHTPDALAAVLRAGRQVTEGRVVVVFGCGGDRDQDKRAEMGAVAQQGADMVVVTSDNPRGEEPQAIIEAIISGMTDAQEPNVFVRPDRRQAIAWALGQAEPGDVVLVAGKGHETVQIIGDVELAFDDQQVVLEELAVRP